MKTKFITIMMFLMSLISYSTISNAKDTKTIYDIANKFNSTNDTIKFDRYYFNENDVILKNNENMNIEKFLKIDNDQQEFFNNIHNDIKDVIQKFNAKEITLSEFKLHIYHNIKLSKMILEDEQYRKYLTVINVTLVNKGLSKYFTTIEA